MSWRKKHAERSSWTEDVFPICQCGGHFWRVSWFGSEPRDGVWIAPSCVREGRWQRVKGAWEILTTGFAWAADIILTEGTCEWLGELLVERARAMKQWRERAEADAKQGKSLDVGMLLHLTHETFTMLEKVYEEDEQGRCACRVPEFKKQIGNLIQLVRHNNTEAIQRKTT